MGFSFPKGNGIKIIKQESEAVANPSGGSIYLLPIDDYHAKMIIISKTGQRREVGIQNSTSNMTPAGEYIPGETYKLLAVVTYQGESYLSRKENNTSLPTTEPDWQKIAKKGDKGDKGDTGDKGDQGDEGDEGLSIFYTSQQLSATNGTTALSNINRPEGRNVKVGDLIISTNTLSSGRLNIVTSFTATHANNSFLVNLNGLGSFTIAMFLESLHAAGEEDINEIKSILGITDGGFNEATGYNLTLID